MGDSVLRAVEAKRPSLVRISANFSGAELFGANFVGVDLTKSTMRGARLAGAKFTGANLQGVSLVGSDLTDADLAQADLRHADLRDCLLDDAVLTEADLRGANLTGSTVFLSNALSAMLIDESTVLDTTVRTRLRIRGTIDGTPADSAEFGIDWSGVSERLRGAELTGVDLRGAKLDATDLFGADLRHANLRGASLRGANLENAKFDGANLSRADLTRSRLQGARLSQADLNHARLTQADLRGTNLLNALSLEHAELSGTVGLSEPDRILATSRGALWTAPPPVQPSPDAERYKDRGKLLGMVIQGRRRQRDESIAAISHLDPVILEHVKRTIATALDNEALIDRGYGLNKRYFHEFEEVAMAVVARLHGSGFAVIPKEATGDE